VGVDEEPGHRVHRQGGEGREGYVDAAGDDDEEGADGEQPRHHHGVGEVDEVVGREELAATGLDQQADRRDHEKHIELVGPDRLADELAHLRSPSWSDSPVISSAS